VCTENLSIKVLHDIFQALFYGEHNAALVRINKESHFFLSNNASNPNLCNFIDPF
jgi:hypothetical protein